MSTSAGSILAGAFGQVTGRPFAVLVWSLISAIVTVAATFASLPLMRMQAPAPDGVDPAVAMAQAASMLGWVFLLNFVYFLVFLWLFAASMRATLRPQESGFAYLRLGGDEFNMVLLGLIFFGALIAGYVGVVILIAIAAVIGAVTTGVAGAVVMGMVGAVAALGVLFWFQTRYSLTFPVSLMRGRLVLGEAWRLTKGRFWSLFAAYFVIGFLVIALWVVVAAVTMGSYYAALLRGGLDPQGIEAASAAQMAALATPSPVMILGWLLSGAIGGLGVALGGGAVATAARDVAPEGPAIAQEFA
jgi:hypothetical protein